MRTMNDYRTLAEDCLRQAYAADDDRDRPLWVTMAQSWLRLAQDAERLTGGEPEDSDKDDGLESTGRVAALN